jgi:hypothetical protein
MRRKLVALFISGLLVLSTAGVALADTTGYEGQPGNQSSSGGGGGGCPGAANPGCSGPGSS